MQREDGSIQSANTPIRSLLAAEQLGTDYGTYRCLVIEVNFIDDKGNTTFDNKQVTYECLILGGRKEGHVISNCKLVNSLGGQYNYHERILRKAESSFTGDNSKKLSDQKGDIVYIQYVQKTSNPIIIGLGTHPLDKTTTGATRADGPREVREYNGVFQSINKNGEFELLRKGGTFNSKGYFVPADRATEELNGTAASELFQARLRFSTNAMLWEDPNSSMEFKKTEKTLTTIVGGTGYKEIIDGAAQKTTRTYKSGMIISEDGAAQKVVITMPSGTLIDIDGVGGKVTIKADGGTSLVIDKTGTITAKATTAITLDAPLVDVGEAAAFSSTIFENLMTEFATHIHSAPQAPAGILPTTPPLVPLMSLVGSQSVKIKD